MVYDELITTTVNEVEYALALCDECRQDEHYEVRATRRDAEATAQYAGVTIVNLRCSSYRQAKATFDALVTVATLDHSRRQVEQW